MWWIFVHVKYLDRKERDMHLHLHFSYNDWRQEMNHCASSDCAANYYCALERHLPNCPGISRSKMWQVKMFAPCTWMNMIRSYSTTATIYSLQSSTADANHKVKAWRLYISTYQNAFLEYRSMQPAFALAKRNKINLLSSVVVWSTWMPDCCSCW